MRRRFSGAVALAAVGAFGWVAPSAYAEGPAWMIASASSPTSFAAGDQTGEDTYVLTVVATGDAPTTPGSPIEVADTLPSGIEASAISGEDLGNGQALSCKLKPSPVCGYEGFEVASGDVLQIEIQVKVSPGVPSSVVNKAMVRGGGARTGVSVETSTAIGSTPAGFGIADFATAWSGTQAGAAMSLTASFTFNQVVAGGGETVPAAAAKDVVLNLPPGFVANPLAVTRCTVSEAAEDACPPSAAVGVVFMAVGSGGGGPPEPYSSLVYNAIPAPGEPGALVLMSPDGPVRFGMTMRTDGDNGLRVRDLSQVDAPISMTVTLWGNPGAHDGVGSGPDRVAGGGGASFGGPGGLAARFLTSGGVCGALPASTISADSWAAPDVSAEASSPTPTLTGCNRLPFDPSLSIAPDIVAADTPSGYELDLGIPQVEDPEGLASSELREADITLPEGAGISLAAADGLQACTERQAALDSTAAATCPETSKIGQVAIDTPLLANPLQGAVYLAVASANPFGAPLAVYIFAEDPTAGVTIKLAGRLTPNPVTGQLTIVLRELPQIPISALKLHFFGGARALLDTPPSCGQANSRSELTPWNGSGSAVVSSAFAIESGVDGLSCSQLPPFSPAFQAGSAGAGEADVYGSLTFLVSRADPEEQLGTLTIQAPPAVQEVFAGVPACGESQASQGTCPAASEVGTVLAQAGLGSDPVDLNGEVYLTGPPPEGTPAGRSTQGLEVVLPVDPGPFELGTAVVRAGEQVDPRTGRTTISSDPLPSVVDGVPLQLKALLLRLDRGEFRLSPEGCESLTVTGTIAGAKGGSVTISSEPWGVSSSPCLPPPPPPAKPPIAIPQGAGQASTVSLAGARIATTRAGEASFQLTCAGAGTCRGQLILTVRRSGKGAKRSGRRAAKTVRVAVAPYAIPPGKTTTVGLKLDAFGRALLVAGHGRLSATLNVLEAPPGPSQAHGEQVQLVRDDALGGGKPGVVVCRLAGAPFVVDTKPRSSRQAPDGGGVDSMECSTSPTL